MAFTEQDSPRASAPYERACRRVFEALDELEQRLSKSRYLFANRIVEADWRLFCTLVRFDPVYHGHFKCNLRRIIDYPNLQGYLMDLYQQPGIAETVNLGSHQAALLHDAHGDQSNPHRSHWSAARPNETARSRKIELRQLPRQQFFIESCASA